LEKLKEKKVNKRYGKERKIKPLWWNRSNNQKGGGKGMGEKNYILDKKRVEGGLKPSKLGGGYLTDVQGTDFKSQRGRRGNPGGKVFEHW